MIQPPDSRYRSPEVATVPKVEHIEESEEIHPGVLFAKSSAYLV